LYSILHLTFLLGKSPVGSAQNWRLKQLAQQCERSFLKWFPEALSLAGNKKAASPEPAAWMVLR
jgi:hypothetical protein